MTPAARTLTEAANLANNTYNATLNSENDDMVLMIGLAIGIPALAFGTFVVVIYVTKVHTDLAVTEGRRDRDLKDHEEAINSNPSIWKSQEWKRSKGALSAAPLELNSKKKRGMAKVAAIVRFKHSNMMRGI